jgi:hypothetical protein
MVQSRRSAIFTNNPNSGVAFPLLYLLTAELHSAVTLFVARWLQETHHKRLFLERVATDWQRLQGKPDPEAPFYELRHLKLDDFLIELAAERRLSDLTPFDIRYRNLPILYNSETWPAWWENGLHPYIQSGAALVKIRGTRLHMELLKAIGERTSDGTYAAKDYEVRDELKRRCKPKLASLAKPA